jgi:hypothetical protein
MAMIKEYTVVCDGRIAGARSCRRLGPVGRTRHYDGRSARAAARQAGWKRIAKGHDADQTGRGMDLCYSCAPNYPDAK